MALEEVTPAIVVRNRDYAESDRIVTLITRDAGKLSGIAKGAKASRRRFERKLELFSHVRLYFRRRPHGELVFITRAEAAELAPIDVADDLGKIALASYAAELADALTREAADSAGAYEVLSAALQAVTRDGASAALRQAFELKILKWAGYELEFGRCRGCGKEPAPEITSVGFVPARGGIICKQCREHRDEAVVVIAGHSAFALARLGASPFEESSTFISGGADAALVMAKFIAGIIDRRLRSAEFLDSTL